MSADTTFWAPRCRHQHPTLPTKVPSTYVGIPSPALGPAVLCQGNDVASLPPQDLTQQSGLLTCLASDLCQVRQKYNCMVQFLSGSRQCGKLRTISSLVDENPIVTATQPLLLCFVWLCLSQCWSCTAHSYTDFV
jgi:hypothetical protein